MKTVTASHVRKIASECGVDLDALLVHTVDGRQLNMLTAGELRKVARVARMSTLVREHVKTAKKSCPPGQVRGPDGRCRPKQRPLSGYLLTGRRNVVEKKQPSSEQTENMESSTPDAAGDVSGAGKTAAWILGAREAICSYSN